MRGFATLAATLLVSTTVAAQPEHYDRPKLELAASAGYAVGGYSAGAEVLWRVPEAVAVGFGYWYTRFPDHASDNLWSPAGHIGAFVVPIRFYWFERGAWDPWAQFIVGWLDTEGSRAPYACDSDIRDNGGTAPAIGFGMGVGRFVSRRLRVTAALDGLSVLPTSLGGSGCGVSTTGQDAQGSGPHIWEARLAVGVTWGAMPH